MKRALLIAALAVSPAARADSKDTVKLLRTDDGGTADGGPTFNGFALGTAVKAKGDLSKDDIRKTVDAHRAEIDACYDELLKRSGKKKPKGTAKLKFEVSADGYVANAEVLPVGFDDKTFVSCAVEKVQKWKFPEPKGGGIVKVAFPIQLEPE